MTERRWALGFGVVRRRLATLALSGLSAVACDRILGFERGQRRVDAYDGGSEGGSGRADAGGEGGGGAQTPGRGGIGGDGGAQDAGAGGSSGVSNIAGDSGAPATAGDSSEGGESNTGGGHSGCSRDDDCTNLEPAQCRVSCERNGARGTCRVTARDADEDRHGSAECQQEPGDDCDDALDGVNPGADEVCDGIDNDCNGNLDLADGLELAGSTLALASSGNPRYPTIAFAPGSAIFGAMWYAGSSGEERLMFGLLAPDGRALAAPVVVNEQPGVQQAVLAAAGDAFAAAWIDSAWQVRIRRITSNAVLDGDSVQVTDDTALSSNLALTPIDGGWAVFWSDLDLGMQGRTFAADGALGAPITFLGAPNIGRADVALLEDRILLLWPTTGGIDEAALLAESLVPISAPVVYGIGNAVSAGPTGFGLAGAKNGLSFFTTLSVDGTPICGPVELPLEGEPTDIAPSTRGFVIVAGVGNVELVEVTSDCTIVQHATVLTLDGTGGDSTVPHIVSAADRGFGLVWAERWNPGALSLRFFGPAYCD